MWEFSGEPNYHFLYDHFIGNVNCIHIVCFNLEDSATDQFKHLNYWLSFLRSRIPPVEPLSKLRGSKPRTF